MSFNPTREAVKMLTAKGCSAPDHVRNDRARQGSLSLFDTDVLRWLLERKFSIDLLQHFNELRIAMREPDHARVAMRTIIGDVLQLIARASDAADRGAPGGRSR